MENLLKRGTCPACMGEFQLFSASGKIVVGKHGWQEAGGRRVGVYQHAWHIGECFGVGLVPFELSPEGTWAYLAQRVYPHCLSLLSAIYRLQTSTPVLTLEVTRNAVKMTLKLTPDNEEGLRPGSAYRTVNGQVEHYETTAYEAERLRQIARLTRESEQTFEHGSKLTVLALAWKLGELLDGTPKGPTVHFQNEGAKLPFCGTKSYGLSKTTEESSVTCSRCQKALDTSKKEQAVRDGIAVDADAVVAYLTKSGPKSKTEIKKALGWDQKRVNKAVEKAEGYWTKDGWKNGRVSRSQPDYSKPEIFAIRREV